MNDILLTNAKILTMDHAFGEIEDGFLAISNGKISAMGKMSELPRQEAAKTIDARHHLVIPGLINTHCHAAMTMFRGLADDRPLDEFLQTVWAAEGAHATPMNIEAAATLGSVEMALCGITHFVDMYWHPQATAKAARSVGLGLTSGPVFVGMDGVDQQPWGKRIDHAEQQVDELKSLGARVMAMPHSCYTMDFEKLKEVASFAQRLSIGIHIHASEAPSEMDMVSDAYNARPTAVLKDTGILSVPTLIAHGVLLTEDEIDLLAESNASIAHCPLSNAKLSSGTAETAKLIKRGVPVSIGTDGPSSSNDLDMWQAMRHASFMSANHTGRPDGLPARDVLAMATREAAKSIGQEENKGVLEVGKDADVVMVDLRAPHLVPNYNPYSTLIYSAGRSDISHVIAGGRVIVAGKRPTFDASTAIKEIEDIAKKIIAGENA